LLQNGEANIRRLHTVTLTGILFELSSADEKLSRNYVFDLHDVPAVDWPLVL